MGQCAQDLGLIEALMDVPLHQKVRRHLPQTKVSELLVAMLTGLPYLEDISRDGSPLDQDRAVAYCRPQPTYSQHLYGRYPNLVKDLTIAHPDQVWCADIAYVRLQHEFIYLAVLLDIFTRAIRGWELGRDLTEELIQAALLRALASHTPAIHHSEQGVQYAANGYVNLLTVKGVQISMAAQGNRRRMPMPSA
jgi:transposase InsO family protein